MTTFDEVFPTAAKMLGERGLLLNAQLLQLVDGDESLFREIRDGLIFDGLAEDRFGVSLARLDPAGAVASRSRTESREAQGSLEVTFAAAVDDSMSDESSQTSTPSLEVLAEADWWLMAGGVTRGPFDFSTMRGMRRRGQIAKMDLVRTGVRGLWQNPDEVPGLADVTDVILPVEPMSNASTSPSSPSVSERPVSPKAKPVEPPHDTIDDGLEYFLWEAGLPVGPISRGELQARLDAGRLGADEFVQVGPNGDWQPVSRALHARRPPLCLPVRAPNQSDTELDVETKQRDAARRSSPTPLPANKARGLESPSRAVASKNAPTPNAKPSSDGTRSSVGQTWRQVADLVGGQRRLWIIVISVATAVTLIVWWRQPPSASAIHREFAECHQKLRELRERRAGPTDWSMALTRERPRIHSLVDGLQKRASSARPAEQELLWAGQHGLLELLKNPSDVTEFERLFVDHMSRAQRVIDPKKASASDGVSNTLGSIRENSDVEATTTPENSAEKNP